MSYFARLKHDVQMYGAVRNVGLAVVPETFPLQSEPRGYIKGNAITLSDFWYSYDKSLNPSTCWLTTAGTALFNNRSNPKRAEPISFGGNVVEILEEIEGHGRLRAFRNSEPAPFTDYADNPQVIHKVTCATRSGAIVNPGNGLDVYFALVGNPELWVELTMVERFPSIGMAIRPLWWVVNGLRGRRTPYGEVISGLYPWSPAVELIGYDPRGSDVWGRVRMGDGTVGFVGLLVKGQEYTNWHMATIPPIPPKV